MTKTKIEWADYTWNPVTGCLHGCEYCYARRIAERFDGRGVITSNVPNDKIIDLGQQKIYKRNKKGTIQIAPYPYGFCPTFHRYRLNEPAEKKSPQTIFVCSMADLFGAWVPDKWIKEVFRACESAPQHRYLFLTKNPYRYAQLLLTGKLTESEHMWLGTTLAGNGKMPFNALDSKQNFISLEPLLEPVSDKFPYTNIHWVIVGAETGNRKGKVTPKREWIEGIVESCKKQNVPVFMKDSLVPIIGEENMLREFPWEV